MRTCQSVLTPALLLWAGLAVSGCNRAAPPTADADMARTTLRTVLDAWKSGAPAESLGGHEPPVFVADRDWRGGARLARYEVFPNDQLFGSDLRCNVWLWLEDGSGKTRKKKATYSVGTNDKLTVVREDDD